MAKGMVITGGVGRGIEHAIVLSIRNAHPDYVVFLVTEQSERRWNALRKQLRNWALQFRLTKRKKSETKPTPRSLLRLPSLLSEYWV